MFGLTSTVGGLRKLTGWRFQRVSSAWMDAVEPIVLAVLKAHAPVGKGPKAGELRDSIRAQRSLGGGGARLEFVSSAPHARYVIGGTRPHEIRPRQARALYWTDSGGGHFAHLVHHPGTKANPFVRRAVRPMEPAIRAAIRAATIRYMDKV